MAAIPNLKILSFSISVYFNFPFSLTVSGGKKETVEA
jgi:hypothetical protein